MTAESMQCLEFRSAMSEKEFRVVFNVCPDCGEYRADKIIDPAGPAQATAVCPICGYRTPFRQLPLLVVCGPSGAGKSAALRALAGSVNHAVLLESDILWGPAFDRPETHYRDFFETWLRMAYNIAQSGRPVVLIGAGFLPANVEACVHRRYFSAAHYLALTCRDDVLAGRLQRRPTWRKSGEDAFLRSQIEFNHWLIENAAGTSPSIALLDTTSAGPTETAAELKAWIASRLDSAG
jgi:hypothetical protein